MKCDELIFTVYCMILSLYIFFSIFFIFTLTCALLLASPFVLVCPAKSAYVYEMLKIKKRHIHVPKMRFLWLEICRMAMAAIRAEQKQKRKRGGERNTSPGWKRESQRLPAR